ncbi:MAG: rhomboid family intramembrane serine protease [Myxococcales bacterium]|nr:MAG: rhomboid family intramembrane serine protease [Myxococcales bacterium]
MFPIHDDNPTLRTPVVTFVLIALNAVVWASLQGFGAPDRLFHSLCGFALIPGELLGTVEPGTRLQLAEGHACVLRGGLTGRAWMTPLSSMFMHGGWLHLLGNMWFLWVFGNNVEDSMGRGRFIVFYLLCGLGAAAAQVASNPASAVPMVGASGAIGGVMGAYAVLHPRAHVHMLLWFGFYVRTVVVPAAFMLGYWFVIQLVMGLPRFGEEGGGVAFWAHAGGFVAGMGLVLIFRNPTLLALQRRTIAGGAG